MISHMNDGEPTETGPSPPTTKRSNIAGLQLGGGKKPAAPARQSAVTTEWKPQRLDPGMFPDRGERGPPPTVANVAYLLEQHGVTARYNVIKKKLEITIPGISMTADNTDNVAMTHILSLAAQNGINTGLVPASVEAIADRHAYNPVEDWIRSRNWDGVDRLPDFYATLGVREGYPEDLKRTLMRKWLLSGVAAALMPTGFKCRGVLTLQGAQGIGKTSWGKRLISDPLLADSVIKTDHHLDGGNKDSLITAVTHFIVEIGELDSSFRRDVSRLKGFLTADTDKVRRPYARTESEYPRRTIFYATVNDPTFLVDDSGNSRWWTIPVVTIDYDHDIDMQQLFAEMAREFEAGAEWWLAPEEERALESQNEAHKTVSVVRDKVLALIDLDGTNTEVVSSLTPTELLYLAGVERPTNPQAKECGGLLRELFGEPRRVNGRDKWRVPLIPEESQPGYRTDPDQPVKDKFD